MTELGELLNQREFTEVYEQVRNRSNTGKPTFTELHMGAIAASFIDKFDDARDWIGQCLEQAERPQEQESVRRDRAMIEIRSEDKSAAKEAVEALLAHEAPDGNAAAVRFIVRGNLARLLEDFAQADEYYGSGLSAFDQLAEPNKQWARNMAYRGLLNAIIVDAAGGVPQHSVDELAARAREYEGEPDPSAVRNTFVVRLLNAHKHSAAEAAQLIEKYERDI